MTPEIVRGRELSKDEFDKLPKVIFHPKAQYAYDCGNAINRYLEGLKNGKILAVKCHKCHRVLVPPRSFCEQCYVPVDHWVEVKDSGIINTFSISYVSADVTRLKEPQLPAVIDIDGASPGIGIMHMLGEVKPKEIKIGMKVKAVWKPAAERTGAITDIKYFKPA
ncbi:MAG: Zn-ribbon domain-containing OB-fold protein [Bacteroidetes bacterium]|nr:Zn-ribbon domain-containing OB-fold protein [Bacteroidota bacterium]